MSAIEYGSYYWCVMLMGKTEGRTGDLIYLHADDVSIDAGSLVFKSSGRRPAGADPKSAGAIPGDGGTNEKPQGGSAKNEMIYIAFGPGSWKMVYAAKLQDGSPASVEHWNKTNEDEPKSNGVPANAGAIGYVPHSVV